MAKTANIDGRCVLITVSDRTAEWQCTECGHVIEDQRRPGYCPDCNCVDGDRTPGVRLFIRRAACGWFT